MIDDRSLRFCVQHWEFNPQSYCRVSLDSRAGHKGWYGGSSGCGIVQQMLEDCSKIGARWEVKLWRGGRNKRGNLIGEMTSAGGKRRRSS